MSRGRNLSHENVPINLMKVKAETNLLCLIPLRGFRFKFMELKMKLNKNSWVKMSTMDVNRNSWYDIES